MLTIQESTNPEFIAELSKELQEERHSRYPEHFVPYDKHAIAKAISELMREKGLHAYVVFDDNEPLGYIMFSVVRKSGNAFTRARSILYIDQITVLSAHQKKGIGMRLMKFAEDYARQEGVDQIELNNWAQNDAARSFFGKNDFEYYNERMFKKINKK